MEPASHIRERDVEHFAPQLVLSWLASCTPPLARQHALQGHGRVAMERDRTAHRRPAWDRRQRCRYRANEGSHRQSKSLHRTDGTGANAVLFHPRRWFAPLSITGRTAVAEEDGSPGRGRAAGSSPAAHDVASNASAAPRPRYSAEAARAGRRSKSHEKNWGAKRHHAYARYEKCCNEARSSAHGHRR